MQKLITKLKNFKLAGMVNSLEARVAYANNNSLSHSEFLELLCEDESNNRSDNSYNKRISKAKLPALKTIEDFDFNFQTSIDKKQISDAITCHYIKEKRNIILKNESSIINIIKDYDVLRNIDAYITFIRGGDIFIDVKEYAIERKKERRNKKKRL